MEKFTLELKFQNNDRGFSALKVESSTYQQIDDEEIINTMFAELKEMWVRSMSIAEGRKLERKKDLIKSVANEIIASCKPVLTHHLSEEEKLFLTSLLDGNETNPITVARLENIQRCLLSQL